MTTKTAPLPGDALKNYLLEYELSQNQLGRLLFVSPRRINEIILGKRAITADTALRLAKFFSTTPEYWLALQTQHELYLSSKKLKPVLKKINPENRT